MSLENKLQQGLDQKEFSLLGEYGETHTWEILSRRERELLALLYIAHGEQLLVRGDSQAIDQFDLALKIDACESEQVFYHLGSAYLSQVDNMRCLTAARQSFEGALRLNSCSFESLLALSKVLMHMAKLQSDEGYLEQAQLKFLEAQSLITSLESSQKAEFYWQWGQCWHQLGLYSNEAYEISQALSKYRQAAECDIERTAFWLDYGNAVLEMSQLLDRSDLILEAIELYRMAVKISSDDFEAWFLLGMACQRIFENTSEEAYYSFAYECFAKAAEIEPDDAMLWLSWGSLTMKLGKMRHELSLFQQSYEKLERANQCEENHPSILLCWGEVQMLLGAYSERIDHLREAEFKIIRSLELASDDPHGWAVYGLCLNELGHYFEDESFYLKAIEKFQYGLSLQGNLPLLWYGLALSHYGLGVLSDDPMMLEKAIGCFDKVVQYNGAFPQFWNDWGVALMHLAEHTDNQDYVEAALEKFENLFGKERSEPVKCSSLHELSWLYNYGCAHDFLGRFNEDPREHEKAIQLLCQVLEYNPQHTDAHYNLALAYSHLGELLDEVELFHKALEHFQKVVNDDCEDEMVWHDYALTLMHLADLVHDPLHLDRAHRYYEEAGQRLHHAIALGHNQALYTQACLDALCGKFSSAMHYIERAELAGVLPSVEDLLQDEWLDPVRHTAAFKSFISLLSGKYEQDKL